MEWDWNDDIVASLDEWEMSGRELHQQFPSTEVAVILKLLNGLTDRLEISLSILIVRPSPRMAEQWWSFVTESAFMVRTTLGRKRKATAQTERGLDWLDVACTALTKRLVRPDKDLTP